MGTTGWSVVIATRTPAAASVARLAMARSRSSTFDRVVNIGPKITGMSRSASTSAILCASVPWLMTRRYPNSSASRRAVAMSSCRCVCWSQASSPSSTRARVSSARSVLNGSPLVAAAARAAA